MKEKKERKPKSKNREIMVITYLFVAAFLAMIGNIVYFVAFKSEDTINNSFNPRQEILAQCNIRGSIYAADGQLLAETKVAKDGTETRNYPFDNLFAQSVGYATHGRLGVESMANFQLLSSDTSISEKVQNDIQNEKNPGNNVYTTLDVSMQKKAFEAMGIYKGAIVVLDAKTGAVLAMVSKPDFNPNTIDADWDEILELETGPLVNRVTMGQYPPGSTFKILTTLAYVRQHPEEYLDYRFNCTGRLTVEGETIQCFNGKAHGNVDLWTSLANSCNCSLSHMGTLLDRKAYQNTMNDLLFNKELPLRFSYKESLFSIDETTPMDEVLQTAIGQGKTLVTPMHMAMITSAIANKGNLYKPYIIDRIESSNQAILKQYGKEIHGSIMSETEAQILTDFMENVVNNGTGRKLSKLSYTAAGKTGSAEFNSNKLDSHAWFTGFAPVEDPQIIVTVIIEGAGTGGDYAVPIAKRLFDLYLLKE